MSDFDFLLHRVLRDGKQYDKLIPKTKCDGVALGEGMTDFTVTEMAIMVDQYYSQTEKIAPLLKKRSLQQTCNAIHEFAYWHFQYKADEEVQYLRSPACSWYSRHTGIDCKSYSIVASCILINLGINHYIRRIKQPGFAPELWTHVYIVVPADQKTGSIAPGYYVIDGTIATNVEPIYSEKSDQYMSMKHIGLNAPAQQGLSGFSLSFFKNMFSSGWSPSCIGGTYDSKNFDTTLAKFVPWFDDIFYQINQAIRENSPSVMQLVNTMLTNAQQIQQHSYWTSQKNWDSSCSKGATKAYAQLGQYYYDIAMKAFLPWLEMYFTITYGSTRKWL
jgi:hypothetical protein